VPGDEFGERGVVVEPGQEVCVGPLIPGASDE
jgi:hypothetical protein